MSATAKVNPSVENANITRQEVAEIVAINQSDSVQTERPNSRLPQHLSEVATTIADRCNKLVQKFHQRTRYIANTYPLHVIAGVTVAAFSLGLLIRLARSNSYE
jgi:hypothetical protein